MGMVRAMLTILRVEGPLALFNGLSASLLRQAVSSISTNKNYKRVNILIIMYYYG
jgi:hypothetical protein